MSNNPSDKLTLYDLSFEGLQIYDLLVENEGELTPELEQRLNAIMQSGPRVVEAAAMVTRSLEASADACANEAQRLAQRASRFHENAKQLKERMTMVVDLAFNGKIKTDKFTIYTQAAADNVIFDVAEGHDIEEILQANPALVRMKLELDKMALKERFKAGEAIPAAITFEVTPGKRSLRIK
jgi:hypothetical protein